MTFAHRISAYNRDRKWKIFLNEIAPKQGMKILDLGFTGKEASRNANYIEKHYPFLQDMIALGLSESQEFQTNFPEVQAVVYNGDEFPFKNKAFDLCWSNAVLEHVGDRDAQLFFLEEIKRVARRAFITTPNRYFPVEVHTRTPLLHYLPKGMFERYLVATGQSWAVGDYMNLLSESDLKSLLSEAGITDYHIYANRLGLFVLDFVIVFTNSGD